MSEQNKSGLLYSLFAILGVLAPWIWFTGFICFALDRVVLYLSKGRDFEVRKLIDIVTNTRISKLESEVELLKTIIKSRT